MTLRQRANPLSCWIESCCGVMVVFVFVVVVEVVRDACVCVCVSENTYTEADTEREQPRTASRFRIIEVSGPLSIVSLFELLYDISFSILPFLEDSSYDLIEEIFLFCPIRCIASSFLSEAGQIIGHLKKKIHPLRVTLWTGFMKSTVFALPSILDCPAHIALQTINIFLFLIHV